MGGKITIEFVDDATLKEIDDYGEDLRTLIKGDNSFKIRLRLIKSVNIEGLYQKKYIFEGDK